MADMTHQAFFVVGHSNWGKSQTLRALTLRHQVRYWSVGHRNFFIRRMSNDDYLDRWADFVQQLDPKSVPYVIIALCPNEDAIRVLERLKGKYDLYFWVIRHSYGDARMISSKEEQALRALGAVQVLEERHDSAGRADAFMKFVAANP